MLKRVLAVLAFVSVISSCATVPITGRKQLNLVSNTEIIQASAAQYKNVLDSSRLSSNAEQVAMIKRVGQRIQTAVETYMKQKRTGRSARRFQLGIQSHSRRQNGERMVYARR